MAISYDATLRRKNRRLALVLAVVVIASLAGSLVFWQRLLSSMTG